MDTSCTDSLILTPDGSPPYPGSLNVRLIARKASTRERSQPHYQTSWYDSHFPFRGRGNTPPYPSQGTNSLRSCEMPKVSDGLLSSRTDTLRLIRPRFVRVPETTLANHLPLPYATR